MVNIDVWIEQFLKELDKTFGERVWFVGLQGSYGRGEATETSDIDMVVILEDFSVADVQAYNSMLDTLPHRELMCGFVSGKSDILSWEPSDLFQFYHDTKDIKGSLDELLSLIDDNAIDRAIKIGVGNIFHGCVHNMLHEKSEEILCGLYKSASFVMQAICFKETGKYISRQQELAEMLTQDDRIIADTFISLKNGAKINFEEMSENLFLWSKKWLNK